jgi:hypothetical protein
MIQFKLRINFKDGDIIEKTFFKRFHFLTYMHSLTNCIVEVEYNYFIFNYIIGYKFNETFPF